MLPKLTPGKKLLAVAFWLLVWQLFAMALDSQLLLVTPVTVVKTLAAQARHGDFWQSVLYSFCRIVSGFLLAAGLGVTLAALSYRLGAVRALLWPVFAVIKATPVASFIILCLIWLSSQSLSVFISFLMVLPVIYTNTLQGLEQTDRELLEMAQVYTLGPVKRTLYIYLPQLQPYLLSSCAVSLGLCWKAGIAGEVIGVTDGSIGERLYLAKMYLSTGELFAWTVVIILISVCFEKLFIWALKGAYRLLERG